MTRDLAGRHMLTESLDRERARRQAAAPLEDMVDAYDHSPGLHCSVDAATFGVLQCDAAFARAVGIDRADLAGRSVLDLFASPQDLGRALAEAARGAASSTAGDFELAATSGVATRLALEVTVARDEAGAPTRLHLIFRDASAPSPNAASVLLVDDNERLRAMLAMILVTDGFSVTTAPCGEAALARVAGGHAFDVVVSDVSMPGMDGRELVKALRALRPRQRFLLVSGFAEDGSLPDVAYLRKPFWPDDLVAELRRLMAT